MGVMLGSVAKVPELPIANCQLPIERRNSGGLPSSNRQLAIGNRQFFTGRHN
jgi:hypothetical protein